MLELMRTHAGKIMMIVALAFVGTMFAGGFLMNDLPESDQIQQNQADYIAFVGDFGVMKSDYFQILNQMINSMNLEQQEYLRLNPELFEQIEYQAWESTLQTISLDELAKQKDISVSRKDTDYFLTTFLNDSGLLSKKELKARLKEQKVSYKDFLDSFNKEVRRKKLLAQLKSEQQVTQQDIDNQFISVTVSFYRFLPVMGEVDRLSKRDWTAATAAAKQYQEALKDRGFDELKALEVSSSVEVMAGKQTAVLSDLPKELIALLREMDLGAIQKTGVLKTGLYLIRLDDRSVLERPADFDLEAAKKSLENQRYQYQVSEIMTDWVDGRKIQFEDLRLTAIDAKSKGNLASVILAYQGLMSQFPSNPVLHYLLGQVFLISNNSQMAKQEFEKADVKSDLVDGFQMPRIHIALGNLYGKEKAFEKQAEQYDKAIAKSPETIVAYEDLKHIFTQLADPKRLKIIEDRLVALKAEKEQREQKKSSQTPQ